MRNKLRVPCIKLMKSILDTHQQNQSQIFFFTISVQKGYIYIYVRCRCVYKFIIYNQHHCGKFVNFIEKSTKTILK